MVKKDKKSKTAEKKARVAQKQEKKAIQKDKKNKNQNRSAEDSDNEDVDLDAVLAEYVKQQEQFVKVTENVCDPPSARASATLLASPSNDNEILLFGGEYFDGTFAKFFNDLYMYNIHRDEWKHVTSPNSPLPRSGHACCRGGNAGGIYVFGGEFSSPKQGTFYHYNDFWRLEPSTREWTKIETKGKGPPARSGHRMTYYKNFIVLFGGFQDTSQQTRYLSDLWLYDCTAFTWHSPTLPPASARPDPRSSFTFLPHDSGAVLSGGYSRVKTAAPSRPTKGASSGAASHLSVLKPFVHQDTWFLRITLPDPTNSATSVPTVRWERRKRSANAPNPPRAGATMAYHKGRGIQFGGVHDVEESEEGIESEFFNTLFAWNVERNRCFSLTLRRPRQAGRKAVQAPAGERARGERGKKDEEELLRNLRALETAQGLGHGDDGDIEMVESESVEAVERMVEKPVLWEMPHPRFNAQLAVQDDVLYIYGGTYENGNREYTFDEMWAIDLGKLDGAKEIFKRTSGDWDGAEEGSSDEDDDSEDMYDSTDDDADETQENGGAASATQAPAHLDEVPRNPAFSIDTDVAEDTPSLVSDDMAPGSATSSALSDNLPHPRPFEALRDFYARTSTKWQDILLESMRSDDQSGKTIKEVRKGAFQRAEEKWWDCREEIRTLEDEQEAAGIGEVISLADKASGQSAGAAIGKRR